MVHAIKMGWMKRSTDKKENKEDEQKYYMLWKDEEEVRLICPLRAQRFISSCLLIKGSCL
jgi:hypothetical protein